MSTANDSRDVADTTTQSELLTHMEMNAKITALTEQMAEERENRLELEKQNVELRNRLEAAIAQIQTPHPNQTLRPNRFRVPINSMPPIEDIPLNPDGTKMTPDNPESSVRNPRSEVIHPNYDYVIVPADEHERHIPDQTVETNAMSSHHDTIANQATQISGTSQANPTRQAATMPTCQQGNEQGRTVLPGPPNSAILPTGQYSGAQGQPLQSEPARHGMTSNPYQSMDPALARKLEEMKAIIQQILGVPAPIKKSSESCYAKSPFVDDIALVEMPRKFNLPHMQMFDGASDPDDYIAQYRQIMFTAAIPRDMREACMCKGFGSSLTGPAL